MSSENNFYYLITLAVLFFLKGVLTIFVYLFMPLWYPIYLWQDYKSKNRNINKVDITPWREENKLYIEDIITEMKR